MHAYLPLPSLRSRSRSRIRIRQDSQSNTYFSPKKPNQHIRPNSRKIFSHFCRLLLIQRMYVCILDKLSLVGVNVCVGGK